VIFFELASQRRHITPASHSSAAESIIHNLDESCLPY